METPKTLRFYSARLFFPLGTPFAITAFNADDERSRCGEFYLFVFDARKGHMFRSRRYLYAAIPRNVISDDALQEDVLRAAQGELDSWVFEMAKQKGRDLVPYDFRFSLTPCSADAILSVLIRRKPLDEMRLMREKTHCEELRNFLPATQFFSSWKIDEDTHA
jgi:hypothetical protein